MKLLDFPIIKLTLCLVSGILIAYYISIPTSILIILVSTGLVSVLLGVLLKSFGKSYWFGLTVFITTIGIGSLSYNLQDQKQWDLHYSNIKPNKKDSSLITFKILKQLKSSSFYIKFEAEVLKIDSINVTGKVLVNIAKDSSQAPVFIDNVFCVNTILKDIQKPKNPFQFNYKNYLKDQHIYAQLTSERSQLIPKAYEESSLNAYAEKFRNRIIKNLEHSSLEKSEISIIQALILGQKQDISKDIYDNYTKAGVIHILAVSGLHVGIIFLILQYLFKPLHRFKYGRITTTIIITILLWTFALVAGLSPSVTRAVTMFTIVAIALNAKRFTNIYNTLAISAFFLLLWNPLYLFNVGFQLSYIAVIAIVSIQPLIFSLWSPKFIILKKGWEVFSVTTAAQLGVLPLSLYYFHQFPGLFFLSNLVIIPFLGILLALGLFVILLAYFNLLPQIVSDLYGGIISILNGFIKWVSERESFLFTELPFESLQVISCYLLLILLYKSYTNKTFNNLCYTLIGILLVQSTFFYYNHVSKKDQLVIFNKNRESVVAIQNSSTLNIYSSLNKDSITQDYIISNYKVGNRIKDVKADSLKSVIVFNNKIVLVVDSLGVYNIKTFKPDYILLRGSPKLNMNRLIDTLKPMQIVADASNYKSYVEQWKTTCREKNIPFHSTYEKGAYILNK